MPDLTLVVLGAGSSSRFEQSMRKQWLRVGDEPLWLYTTRSLAALYPFKEVIVTASHDDFAYAKKHTNTYRIVQGGESRQASLLNALLHVNTPYVMVSDSARACIDAQMVERLLALMLTSDCVVPYLPCVDTVVYEDKTIDREHLKLIQTPQLCNTERLKTALNHATHFTDESSAIQAIGGSVSYVLGDVKAKKLTCKEDLALLPCLKEPSKRAWVAQGFDVHAFEEGKPMVLGGVMIDSPLGFKAHSDGDVAIHALIDALLGAAGAGDIGEFFPDTDPRYKNADSKALLKEVCAFLERVGFEISHCDLTIMAEFPKLGHLKEKIRFCLASLLNIAPHHLNIKATTTETLGFIGRKEGVAVSATATLHYAQWKNA